MTIMKICPAKRIKVSSRIHRLVKVLPYDLMKSLVRIKLKIEGVPVDNTMVDPFTKFYLKGNMMVIYAHLVFDL